MITPSWKAQRRSWRGAPWDGYVALYEKLPSGDMARIFCPACNRTHLVRQISEAAPMPAPCDPETMIWPSMANEREAAALRGER